MSNKTPTTPDAPREMLDKLWHQCVERKNYGMASEVFCFARDNGIKVGPLPSPSVSVEREREHERQCREFAAMNPEDRHPGNEPLPLPDTPQSVPADLRLVIERDRSNVARGVAGIKKAISAYRWLIDGGRGSYAWDDDRWRDEFGRAVNAIEDALAPLAKIAADLSNSPTNSAEVHAARAPDAPLSQGEDEGLRVLEYLRVRKLSVIDDDRLASLIAERDKLIEEVERHKEEKRQAHLAFMNSEATNAKLVERVSVLEKELEIWKTPRPISGGIKC
jgi:hypothetical protein